jgi:uncharacterized repeat protein (TIGR03803 family)
LAGACARRSPQPAFVKRTLLLAVLATTALGPRASLAAWKGTTLYTFTGGDDGATPIGGLIADKAGNLYGAAANGGAGDGTIFELSPPGKTG